MRGDGMSKRREPVGMHSSELEHAMGAEAAAGDRYEVGYRNGESSGHADWTGALGEVVPWEVVQEGPTAVAAYIRSLS
jgi:hypothetical protein